jgi:hypothetical protein
MLTPPLTITKIGQCHICNRNVTSPTPHAADFLPGDSELIKTVWRLACNHRIERGSIASIENLV